uniref:photosystem II protein Z n=1 Tax=Glaucosphaera vacuolata TaxID=38265 RepID=UPI001FCDBBC9|nr:photosystem II protein Z [Glaucosphaera vacuolata]UNJ18697.1 photosystem II protein Z [Glaucosphaera vacuolata]
MVIAIQFLVLTLVILSILLVVGIPVVLASPKQWEQSKNLILVGSGLWAGLVLLTGFMNSLTT